MADDVAERIRGFYEAFLAQDRATLERGLTDDFTFTSPLDDRIGKAEFFARCLPGAKELRALRIEALRAGADEAFVRYRAVRSRDGVAFSNVEHLRLRDGRIREVSVFFGREERGG